MRVGLYQTSSKGKKISARNDVVWALPALQGSSTEIDATLDNLWNSIIEMG